MSTRCVACRKPVKRGQLFCPDCLEKRAPASARKRERRRLWQLLELILSLPFLMLKGSTRNTVWENMRQIQSDPGAEKLFIETAASMGIKLSIAEMDTSTVQRVLEEMATRSTQESGREKPPVFDVQRRLLALSSSLLVAFVVALTLLSLVLLIIN